MNSHKIVGFLIASAIASGVGLLVAQDEPTANFAPPQRAMSPATATLPAPPNPVQGQNGIFATGWRANGLALNRGRMERSKVQEAMASLKAAESGDDKAKAKAKLQEALAAEYDERMDSYDEHIESLEKELEAMRQRLAKRREAKADMVELKMRQLLAEVDGLGWPSGSNNSRFPRVINFGTTNYKASPRATLTTRPSQSREIKRFSSDPFDN